MLEHLVYTHLDILDVIIPVIWPRSVVAAHLRVFSRKWGARERRGCECGQAEARQAERRWIRTFTIFIV
jgi:hypothetical protein